MKINNPLYFKIHNKLLEIMERVLGDLNNNITWDDLDITELILEVEKEFDIQIPDDEAYIICYNLGNLDLIRESLIDKVIKNEKI